MTQNFINITVNGEVTKCAANIFLPNLLKSLDFNPRLIALEYNGEILHRQYWDSTIIHQGDRLEVVTIVGGG
ncbi:sulfur carrier protein ThiS [Geminocystis sp. NIES-3709]|uniref:sulfur carrier protein ThiS n=1 Tax=Geminocystis sp. NIES-3709 TaxID=1617448 RepID=UPI0005FC9808|nr:sulfur carrier protein ThiS [Geminocystis sp. NIES-3709]BAQ65253.1 sulfur carrier protein ThiS [Geminocystis sp. NIES-3709]